MINSGIKIIETADIGLGLVAVRDFRAGEWVADWTGGVVYRARSWTQLPPSIQEHALQFSVDRWIDVRSGARFINHSCNPNCGMKGLFKIVAMRDVAEGEALVWDYEMADNSDRRMACQCGSQGCRGVIGTYDHMPAEIKRRYRGFVSPWLSRAEECIAA